MASSYNRGYFESRRMGRVLEAPRTIHDPFDAYVHGLPPLVALSPELEILDLGCGLGQGSWWLSQRCRQVTAVDSSDFAIDFCRRTYRAGNLRFLESDVFGLDLPAGRFDLILIMDLLEHLESSQHLPLLERCRGWLREGGRLVIHAPIAESRAARWSHRRQDTGSLDHTGDPTHRSTFSVRSLQALVGGAGFQVIKRRFTYGRFILSRSAVRHIGKCLALLPPLRNELVQGIYTLARPQQRRALRLRETSAAPPAAWPGR